MQDPIQNQAVRELLSAVLEALTLPYDTPDYDRRIVDRATLARTVLDAVTYDTTEDLGWNADWLRGRLTAEQTEAAERGARR